MDLLESDPSLSSVCRAVEARVQGADEPANLELSVVLLLDFESLPDLRSLPEGKARDVFRQSPTLYQVQPQRILINGANFFSLLPDVAEAALAHEVGHAVCERDSLMKLPRYKTLNSCIVADFLACRWGFCEGLRKERLESYGPQYCEILQLWGDEQEFIRRVSRWYQVFLAGGYRRRNQGR